MGEQSASADDLIISDLQTQVRELKDDHERQRQELLTLTRSTEFDASMKRELTEYEREILDRANAAVLALDAHNPDWRNR